MWVCGFDPKHEKAQTWRPSELDPLFGLAQHKPKRWSFCAEEHCADSRARSTGATEAKGESSMASRWGRKKQPSSAASSPTKAMDDSADASAEVANAEPPARDMEQPAPAPGTAASVGGATQADVDPPAATAAPSTATAASTPATAAEQLPAVKQPTVLPSLPPPSAATRAKKSGLSVNFKLIIPADVLELKEPSATPIDVALVPHVRGLRVGCAALAWWIGSLWTVVRLVLAVPVGLLFFAALFALILLLQLQLLWLLPLALLLGLLLPGEQNTDFAPMALPGEHVVVLGGGHGLTRAVALECVRRGADVTVLAAGASRHRTAATAVTATTAATTATALTATTARRPHRHMRRAFSHMRVAAARLMHSHFSD